MTREEQIEEMAEEIFKAGIALEGTDFAYGLFDDDDHFHRLAKVLFSAGYRKAEDVRRETLKEVLQELYSMIEYEKMGLDDEFLYGLNLAEDQIFILCEKYGVEVE